MRKTIFIADDNPHIRLLLTQFLIKDFDVKAFEDGSELMNGLLQGNIPDLIIADILMPKLNGWDLINKIKGDKFFKQIPVVMLSGVDKSEEKVKYLNAGVNDFMVKPFSPQELLARITKILN